MKILTIVGARPQFVKAAALNRLIQKTDGVSEVVVHTGQHYDPGMSDVFFEELGIEPAGHYLDINGGNHGDMTGRMMVALEPVMLTEKPDWVLVYGDTNSTLAAAICAVKLHIPIAHIEAGLRSFNRKMPEELNRILTDHASDVLLCPTHSAMNNLKNEGLSGKAVLSGDIMYDASLYALEVAKHKSTVLEDLGLSKESYALATIHRAENTSDAETLGSVLDYLRAQAKGQKLILPVHPRTSNAVKKFGLSFEGIDICAPVGPLDMAMLTANCSEVFTDSGGLQKEAYFFRRPCTTLRDETEWTETIEKGWNRLWKQPVTPVKQQEISEYGDGRAAVDILKVLREH